MMNFLFVTLFVFISTFVWAQTPKIVSDNIADCAGATAILTAGKYSLQFTGENGNINDLDAYPSLKSINEKNSIWCSYTAQSDGRLSLEAFIPDGKIQFIAFQNESDDVCEGIYNGSSEVKRIIQDPSNKKISLSLVTNENSLYPLELKKGEQVLLFFNTQQKGKPILDLTINFEKKDGVEDDEEDASKRKVVDLRKKTSRPTLSVMVRDVETGNPIIADITFIDVKLVPHKASGSDFYFSIDKTGKVSLKCDAPGYFFYDKVEQVSGSSESEMVVWMQPLGVGKSIKIDEIEFKPGTSEFMPSADEKLKRLKDFLALNAGIKVEIQGHVNATGDNTNDSQKLSEARAKRVMNYLIANGISKDRLTSVGFGNSKPVYEKPKFPYEEQANRCVEVKVL